MGNFGCRSLPRRFPRFASPEADQNRWRARCPWSAHKPASGFGRSPTAFGPPTALSTAATRWPITSVHISFPAVSFRSPIDIVVVKVITLQRLHRRTAQENYTEHPLDRRQDFGYGIVQADN